MFLKTLTIRGFKSFAASTTLRFEPGITCVVGPNGSGKSNVVDAIAWVLGEQGAKALRGGAMADVIFAGTSGRPALGRAEVVLTIDNSDGALPIEFTEVSVSRLLYRSGESEYAINATPCRLLDVQELMSDSGIGRELHVIVGQGQLDAVLAARPEDRRGFIEEAAGVLKHRKRKERALRKLEAMQANLARVTDLTAELRRQLGPLGRQAEVARRAGAIQATLRDARLRLLADDLTSLRDTVRHDEAEESALLGRQEVTEREIASLRAREDSLESALAEAAPALGSAQETYVRFAGLRERLHGLESLAGERARHLQAVPAAEPTGRDPEALVAEAAQLRARESELAAQHDSDLAALETAAQDRGSLELSVAAQDQRLVALARAESERRERQARLQARVAALSSRADAAKEEVARTSVALAESQSRAASAAAQAESLRHQAGGIDTGEEELLAAHEAATGQLNEAESALREAVAEERRAGEERAAALARQEALTLALTRRDATAMLLDAAPAGLLGTVAALVQVEPGWQAAVAAALGPLADALAVDSTDTAATALAVLREGGHGRAGMLVAGGHATQDATPGPGLAGTRSALPPGVRAAADVVSAPGELAGTVERALAGVVVVADLAAARALVSARPELRAATREGDLLGSDWAIGGAGSAPSLLEMRGALDEATSQAGDATARVTAAGQRAGRARERVERTCGEVERALEALHESDARMAALSEQLGLAGAQERAGLAEVDRLEQVIAAAGEVRQGALAELAVLEQRGEQPGQDVAGTDPEAVALARAERERLVGELDVSRAAEVEARLTARTSEERLLALAGRAEELDRTAAEEVRRREQVQAHQARRRRAAALALAVAETAGRLLAAAESGRTAALAERDCIVTESTVREGELLDVRSRLREAIVAGEALRDSAHRDELARAEQRLRIEALVTRAAEEFGVDEDSLVEEYGPQVAVPPDDPETGRAVPYERGVQERRATAAERQLAQLGRVNPLALEEFSALEERHAFLAAQVEDLTRGRRDLLGIVREVDERILAVFQAAFEDTAREFETVFATLFPGGEGRLTLTDPDDLLTTGVEVHARPAGKRLTRLSLLSGGERSLAATALLIAIFRARPSPFYVLDEVEAALDDRNLGRLLDCLEGLRSSSQLIVITHQKRTMEIADALYGVSMRDDGISAVISQRLRESATA